MAMQVEHKTEKGTVLFQLLNFEPYYPPMVINESQSSYLIYKKKAEKGYKTIRHKLPKADWQLIGLTSEVTEEQCKWIMHIDNFKGYDNFITGEIEEKALESFKSLIEFRGIKQPSLVLFKIKKI